MRNVQKGDRVIVPWGLDEVEGIVVDAFGAPGRRIVSVAVLLDEDNALEDADVIGFPQADVRLADVTRA